MQADSRIIHYIRSEGLKACYSNVVVVSDLFNVPREQVKELWQQVIPDLNIRQPYTKQTVINSGQLEMLKSLYMQGYTPKSISQTLNLPLKPVQNMVHRLVYKGLLPKRSKTGMPEHLGKGSD